MDGETKVEIEVVPAQADEGDRALAEFVDPVGKVRARAPFYFHLEVDAETAPGSQTGAVTLSVLDRGPYQPTGSMVHRFDVGVAFCAPGEQFNRRLGRTIADGRRHKYLKATSVYPHSRRSPAAAAAGVVRTMREGAFFAFMSEPGNGLGDRAIAAFVAWLDEFSTRRPLWIGRSCRPDRGIRRWGVR